MSKIPVQTQKKHWIIERLHALKMYIHIKPNT